MTAAAEAVAVRGSEAVAPVAAVRDSEAAVAARGSEAAEATEAVRAAQGSVAEAVGEDWGMETL